MSLKLFLSITPEFTMRSANKIIKNCYRQVSGIPEMLIPGTTGLLFAAVNVEALTEQVLAAQLMANSKMDEMGRAGYHFAIMTIKVDHPWKGYVVCAGMSV